FLDPCIVICIFVGFLLGFCHGGWEAEWIVWDSISLIASLLPLPRYYPLLHTAISYTQICIRTRISASQSTYLPPQSKNIHTVRMKMYLHNPGYVSTISFACSVCNPIQLIRKLKPRDFGNPNPYPNSQSDINPPK